MLKVTLKVIFYITKLFEKNVTFTVTVPLTVIESDVKFLAIFYGRKKNVKLKPKSCF